MNNGIMTFIILKYVSKDEENRKSSEWFVPIYSQDAFFSAFRIGFAGFWELCWIRLEIPVEKQLMD
jgi:hypothetical protein